MKKNSIIFVCIVATLLFTAGMVVAFTPFTGDFNAEYGTAGIFWP